MGSGTHTASGRPAQLSRAAVGSQRRPAIPSSQTAHAGWARRGRRAPTPPPPAAPPPTRTAVWWVGQREAASKDRWAHRGQPQGGGAPGGGPTPDSGKQAAGARGTQAPGRGRARWLGTSRSCPAHPARIKSQEWALASEVRGLVCRQQTQLAARRRPESTGAVLLPLPLLLLLLPLLPAANLLSQIWQRHTPLEDPAGTRGGRRHPPCRCAAAG